MARKPPISREILIKPLQLRYSILTGKGFFWNQLATGPKPACEPSLFPPSGKQEEVAPLRSNSIPNSCG